MPLIFCPECNNKISNRAESCPHCGLPAKYFGAFAKQDNVATASADKSLDLAALRNVLISFDHSYQTFLGADHYITARELTNLKASFKKWVEQLSKKTTYDYCKENAAHFSVDIGMVSACLRHYETLDKDAESHNAQYTDRIVEQNKSYFDNLLKDIDPNIKLDDEQRRAVVADDDYCLLVAGAGAGKTTTMAAKVK
jgi:DNA helicase-4